MSQPSKLYSFNVHDVTISSVTVFHDRAEVTRTLNAQLVAGVNEVLIQNVSKHAVVESLRVDGRGPAVIHDVQFQCKPSLPEEGRSPKVKKLEEERKKVKSEKESLEDKQNVLKRRIEVLDEIAGKVGGSVVRHPSGEEPTPFTLHDESLQNLSKFFEFYEDSSMDVRHALRQVDEQAELLDNKLKKLNDEIGRADNDERFARHISVLLESTEGGEVELDVSYQVWTARWNPSYDIRIDSPQEGENHMKMTYYGSIEQNTGEDWENVPLILSTAQPSLGGDMPELGTQVAELSKPQSETPGYPPVPFRGMALANHFAVNARAYAECDELEAMESMMSAPVEAADTVLSTTFVIARPATIPSDSSEHKVTVTSLDMKPVMIHEVVPSKSTNVYLTASVINSSRYPFLHGQANVYLNNSFVAKTYIKPVSPNERFICSLGVDTAIKVEYRPAHKFSEQVGLLTKASSTVHTQKITIKNTKDKDVLITVKEHVPKSTDEKIKIKLFSPELDPKAVSDEDPKKRGELPKVGARLNSAHNLEWTVNVEPNKETELLVKWTVDHPNGEQVQFREQF